jgi:hypothetical protein
LWIRGRAVQLSRHGHCSAGHDRDDDRGRGQRHGDATAVAPGTKRPYLLGGKTVGARTSGGREIAKPLQGVSAMTVFEVRHGPTPWTFRH